MGSILVCSTPVSGQVTPMLDVVRHLVGRGHRVRVLTGARFADSVELTGAEHLALPSDVDDVGLAAPAVSGIRGWARNQQEVTSVFITPMTEQLAALDAAMAVERPDIIICDSTFAGGAALSTRPPAARPPLIVMGLGPLMTTDPDVAPYGWARPPLRGPMGASRNRVLALGTHKLALAPCHREVDRLTEQATGRRLGMLFSDWPQRADAFLQLTIESFEYPRRTPPANLRFIGPPRAITTHRLPTWWDEIDDRRPIVVATQGTRHSEDFGELIAPTMEALANEDCWLLISTGGRSLSMLPDGIPDNARAATFLPFSSVLPRAAALITNGGYPTVHAGIEHGVPMVVAPSGMQAREVAARVSWAGIGIDLRTNHPSPSTITRALRQVISEPEFRTNAEQLSQEVSGSPGLDALDTCIQELALGRSPASTF